MPECVLLSRMCERIRFLCILILIHTQVLSFDNFHDTTTNKRQQHMLRKNIKKIEEDNTKTSFRPASVY